MALLPRPLGMLVRLCGHYGKVGTRTRILSSAIKALLPQADCAGVVGLELLSERRLLATLTHEQLQRYLGMLVGSPVARYLFFDDDGRRRDVCWRPWSVGEQHWALPADIGDAYAMALLAAEKCAGDARCDTLTAVQRLMVEALGRSA